MSDSNKPTSGPEKQSSSSEQRNSDQTGDEISEPCLDNTDNSVGNESPLTEGHIESLNITVVDREVDPIWRYNAQLDVLLEDGAQLPLNIWSVHDVPLSWQVGASYTLKNVKHKIRETATGQESVLRSTSSFTATRISKNTSRESSMPSATNESKDQEVGSDECTGTNDIRSNSQSDNLGNNQTNAISLPDDRINKLTVRVLAREEDPEWKNDDELTVLLSDGRSLPLHIWSVHDVSFSWQVGATYVLTQVRHKVQEDSESRRCLLHSTKQLQVERISATDPSGTLGGSSQLQSDRSGFDDTYSALQRKIIDEIQNSADATDDPIVLRDFIDDTAVSFDQIREEFGSWKHLLDIADIDNRSRLINDIQRVCEKLGHQPTAPEMYEHGRASAATVTRYFDTYTAALTQAFKESEVSASATNPDSRAQDKEEPKNPTTTSTVDEQTSDDHNEGTDSSKEKLDLRQRDMVLNLNIIAQNLGHLPSKEEINTLGEFDYGEYLESFDDLFFAYQAAGIVDSKVTKSQFYRKYSPTSTDETGSTYDKEHDSLTDPDKRAQDHPGVDDEATSNLINEISHFVDILQEPPSKELLIKYGKYDPKVYTETFDTWESAIEASGHSPEDLPSNERREYSNLDILDGIQEAATAVGHVPSTTEADNELEFSAALASLRFGSWNTAVDIAVSDDSSFSNNRNTDSPKPSKKKESDVGYSHSNRDTQNGADIQDVIEDTLQEIMETDGTTES